MADNAAPPESIAARRRWMAVLARAPRGTLESAWETLAEKPDYRLLRAPETGLAQVRGRIGGNGAPFNLGEMTVTRCVAQLADGTSGYAYIAGRDARQAELAAVFDALLQDPRWHERVHEGVITPLARAHEQRRRARAAKVAATQVDFFTLVRGDD